MSQKIRILPGLLLVIAHAALAQSGAQVASTLSVTRIALNAEGREVAEPANSAKPGDVLEYVADYTNQGKHTALRLQASLPIPFGTEYLPNLPNSATPAPSLASVDGITFQPIPLKRQVRQANGTLLEQPLAYAQYRFLRWPAHDLAAGKHLLYSTRVKVAADATSATSATAAAKK